ncbi:hypothetical protein D3C86_1480170 [compost metagenome]
MRQQRVAGDVERHAEEDVGAALVELAGQLAIGHVELEERVAGRQLHLRDFAHVPGRDDQAARVRVVADLLHQVGNLVHVAAVRCRPGAPLVAVDRAEFAILVSPLVPDRHAVFLQVGDVGRALEEPQQFVDDGLQVQLLGGDHREALVQVEAHLVAEHRTGARAGAVGLVGAMLVNMAHEVEILFHRLGSEGGEKVMSAPWGAKRGFYPQSEKQKTARRRSSAAPRQGAAAGRGLTDVSGFRPESCARDASASGSPRPARRR